MIVLDASAVIEWLLQTPTGTRIEQRIFSAVPNLHTPHLLDVEVAQVLRRYVAAHHYDGEPSRGGHARPA